MTTTEKGPTVSAKQMAMSRALGAAFLSHQVEQLEKSVGARGVGSGGRGGLSSGNWRERRQQGATGGGGGGGGYRAAAATPPQSQNHQVKRAPNGTPSTSARSAAPPVVGVGAAKKTQTQAVQPNFRGRVSPVSGRKSSDEERDRDGGGGGRDADVVVVDASVLVHALYQVKRWCKEGRDEIVIVPLEALNTLDLLKKGTSSLAQRARAASRILEAQVGTNPRIRVQQDDAFVYWDKIAFNNAATPATATATGTDSDPLSSEAGGKSTPTSTAGASSTTTTSQSPLPSPEWVRRTICCARWEVENPQITLAAESTTSPVSNLSPRVVLAILSHITPTATAASTTSQQSSSPQTMTVKLNDNTTEAGIAVSNSGVTTVNTTTPIVPLPAPTPGNKFEARSMGTLVSHWAAKAGIEILEVEASAPGHGRVNFNGARDEDEDARVGKKFHGHGGHGGHGRRKPSIGNSGVAGTANNLNGGGGSSIGTLHASSTGLVERPPAVMAMMEMVSQPSSKGKVVRVLARGEKLDP